MVPKNVPVKWFIGPRKSSLEEEWEEVKGAFQDARKGFVEIKDGKREAAEA